jgi:hypothetical protein
MTATLPDVTPRRKAASSPELNAATEHVRLAKEQGLALARRAIHRSTLSPVRLSSASGRNAVLADDPRDP